MTTQRPPRPARGPGDKQPPYPYPRCPIPYSDYLCRPYAHGDTLWPTILATASIPDKPKLLDVGGGNGIMAKGYWDAAGADLTVLDIWDGYQHEHPGRFICDDAENARNHFEPKSFDVVQCTEMLEHIFKEKGLRIVPILESLAKEIILFTTPCGYDVQRIEAQGNPHQVHVSGWDPEEFLARGYEVLINGPEMADTWKEPDQSWATPQLIAWKVRP